MLERCMSRREQAAGAWEALPTLLSLVEFEVALLEHLNALQLQLSTPAETLPPARAARIGNRQAKCCLPSLQAPPCLHSKLYVWLKRQAADSHTVIDPKGGCNSRQDIWACGSVQGCMETEGRASSLERELSHANAKRHPPLGVPV